MFSYNVQWNRIKQQTSVLCTWNSRQSPLLYIVYLYGLSYLFVPKYLVSDNCICWDDQYGADIRSIYKRASTVIEWDKTSRSVLSVWLIIVECVTHHCWVCDTSLLSVWHISVWIWCGLKKMSSVSCNVGFEEGNCKYYNCIVTCQYHNTIKRRIPDERNAIVGIKV